MKNAVKRAGKNIAITLALASVLGLASCKKEAAITPETSTVSAADQSSKLDYKSNQPISLNGAHDITISGESITGGALDCISLTNCYNIRITNCRLTNSSAFAVKLSKCNNIVVDKCYMDNVQTGVFSLNGQNIQVTDNTVSNIKETTPGESLVQFEAVRTDGLSSN